MTALANKSASGTQTIRLPATTGIRDGATLRQQLLPLLEAPEPVVIDVTDIERVDTVALQLLFAFNRDRCANGRSVVWQGDNLVWRNAAASLGLKLDTSAAPSSH